ncbi:MAG TPA: hypothetical protein VIY90_08705 [Steroidobacteraceae bacterium]
MLTDSPVMRAAGARILFLAGAAVTVAVLLWMHQLRSGEELPGLTAIFFVEFAYQDYWPTACELLILVAAVFIASRIPARTLLRAVGERPATVAAITLVILCAGALGVYHDHPLSMDEYAAYFQSQVFAGGHLTGQFPLPQKDWLIPPGFQNFFLTISPATGQVASSYWPAHALILAGFTALDIPWACNPVLSALTVLVVHRLARYMFAQVEAAGLAVLLTVCSPVFFGIGISYYSMPAHLLANCLYALLLARPDPRRALAAGFVGSIALCLHNPVPHILFAVPWLVWIATRRGGLRLLAALCLGYLPLCLLLGVGWFELLQHLRTAVPDPAAHAGTAQFLKSMLSIFSPPTATVLLGRGIGVAKIWVWAVPGLLILAGWGAVRWRHNTLCLLLAASAVITLVGYVFFPADQGHGWGNRYFHSAWMALPLLATAAVFRPAATGTEPANFAAVAAARGIFENPDTESYLTACILLTLVFGVGLRAWQMQAFMASDLSQLPHYRGTERRVVIVDYATSFYGADLVQNDPWLRGNVIRMMTHGAAEDRRMMAQNYPTWHKVYGDRFGTVWSAAK